MKKNLKGRYKFLTYIAIASISSNIIYPTIAAAEELDNISQNNMEIKSTDSQNGNIVEKITLNEKIDLTTLTESKDNDFFSQINIELREKQLIISYFDETETYNFNLGTYTGEYTISENTEGMQEIQFNGFPTEKKIAILVENNNTLDKYNLTFTLNSEELNSLENVRADISKAEQVTETENNLISNETNDVKENILPDSENLMAEENDKSITVESEETTTQESKISDKSDANKTFFPNFGIVEEQVEEKTNPVTTSSIQGLIPLKRVAINGIYTVRTGDTLENIAKEFGISLAQIAVWNSISKDKVSFIKAGQGLAVSQLGVESRLSDEERSKVFKGGTISFGKQEFINYIAPYAKKVASLPGEEPIYASVIIAQAIHESAYGNSGLASPPNYNLTGIKGSYNGEYVKMWTWEHVPSFKADVKELANFRKYPSYYEAILDHGKKMRYGTSWNSKIYSGTWVKNTTSYKDATAALDGVYATDPYGYARKLNNYIELYNLTDYDIYDSFLTKKEVNYDATVSSNNEGIYTRPLGMKDAVLYTSFRYNDKEVKITEEATTQSGTFVKLVRTSDRGTIGWIKKSNMNIFDEFLTKFGVNYDAVVSANNKGIYTKPLGMKDAILYTSYKYNNKEVKISEEATTQSGTFVKLIRISDRGTIGWIKKSDVQLKNYDTFLTKYKMNYRATVLENNKGIFTKPQGMRSAILYTSFKYNNKTVIVGEEATTQGGTFVKLIRPEDRGTIGWIKKSDISK
ncbi:GW dipeptide domain-containing protein [Marinilactibacillus psychrotolerans]|uniref:GW dipeptide domain-containing protein n=1 Tax=Marinilactibacillus psychrotolerans TaxID=191770 RepID=UPI003885C4C8